MFIIDIIIVTVSVPYEITLLSNTLFGSISLILVSVPYEITLLSNPYITAKAIFRVSVPYEITLLSNNNVDFLKRIKFQYLMKLHYSQTR